MGFPKIDTPHKKEMKRTKIVGKKVGNFYHFPPCKTQFENRASLIRLAASTCGLIAECTYNFDVIALDECPKALLMTSMPTPWLYIRVAAVWRAS
jgi:hypothetical protein